MRRHKFVPLLVFWLLAVASTAHAAVPVGDDGSLRPRDGAELIQAVGLASASGPPVSIVLGRGEYAIDRTLDLTGIARDELVGDSAGETVIRGTAGVSTLLRVNGPATVGSFSLQPDDEAVGTYPVVRLSGGARLDNAVVSVPDTLPDVTAVDTAGASLLNVELESQASRKPALHSTGELSIGASSIYGGNPTVDLDGQNTLSTTTMSRAFLAGGPDSDAVLRVHTGSGATTVRLQESIVRAGDAEAPRLIDLEGASSPLGTIVFDAQRSTISGPPESTSLRTATDRELVPTLVTLGGMLALGSETTIDCMPGGLIGSLITITAIYRSGENDTSPGSGCVIVETGRRTGGDPSLTTDRGLKWGSPAIDAIPRPLLVTEDAYRGERTSTGPKSPPLTPTDLGALEYQYLPPALDDPTTEVIDDAGTVRFSVTATDGNEDEGDLLTVVWRFSDGATATGTTVTHRFSTPGTGSAIVTATDPSGLETQLTVPADARFNIGPVPSPTPEPTPGTTEPTPTPAPTPAPQQTLPETVELPKGSGGSQATLTSPAAIIRSLTRTSARAQRTPVRPSGFGQARDGEAGVQLDLSTASNLTVLARRRSGTKLLTVPNARISVDVSAGTAPLHFTSRFGGAALRPGLYRLTILVRPVKGTNARRDLFVRVLR